MPDYIAVSLFACGLVVGFGIVRWLLDKRDGRPDNYEAARRKLMEEDRVRHLAQHEAFWRLRAQQKEAQRRLAKRLNNDHK